MIGIEPDMQEKLASIGFRQNTGGFGIGARARVEQVEITAVESPLGLHLTFTAHGQRTHTQHEVQVNRGAVPAWIAQVIVETLEKNFAEFIPSARGEA